MTLVLREQLRLGVVFRRALVLAVGVGCGSTTIENVYVQAEAGTDAQTPVDSGVDARDANVDKCLGNPYLPPVTDTCGDYYSFPCGLPQGLTSRGDCYFSLNDCNTLCPDIHYNCHAIEGYCSTKQGDAGVPGDGGDAEAGIIADGVPVPDEAGVVKIDCSVCPGSAGRLPAGFVAATETRGASVLGAYYANAAQLEAASVTAFVRLRDDLASFGAPAELCDAATVAAADEVRHTLAMSRLARRHGARYERPVIAPASARTLAEITEENVVEGCARETFSALLAAYQAEHAADADTRRVLAQVAADEARHAALSWAVARWSLAQLPAADRTRIVAAWDAAMNDVACASDDRAERIASAAALPSRKARLVLAEELRSLRSELAA